MAGSLLLRRLFFLLVLVLLAEANVRENRAIVDVKCDVSAMYLQMTFTHPFRGIVFTHNNFFNPACSSAASPASTSLQLNLTLPFDSCDTHVQHVSNKSFASNTVIVLQHRMLDTVYDYVQNVSCELSRLPNPLPMSAFNTSFEEPRLDSWIALELGAVLYPEEIVDIKGIGAELMLTYHVVDGGVHKDMIVKNCIGHDDVVVDEKTKIYQISNPYGCASDSDLVTNFTLIRNPGSGSNMVAYATLRNVSLLSRGKFYITCGAELCKDACKRQCIQNKKQDPIIFSDMATKGMVNRAFDSKMPSSLSMFERFDRQRRSYNKTETEWVFRDSAQDQNYELIQKLDEVVSRYPDVFSENSTSENTTLQSEDSDFSVLPHSAVTESQIRSRRAVKIRESKVLSSIVSVILVKSNETGNITTYSHTSVNANVTLFNFTQIISGTSTQPSQDLQNKKPNEIFKLNGQARNVGSDSVKKTAIDTDSSSLLSTIRTIITVFALFCLGGTCFNVFLMRRERDTLSVSDYITYSEF